MHLTRHSIISISDVSVKENDLEVDCILKALASILSSGQGCKWVVGRGLQAKQQMLLMPTAL